MEKPGMPISLMASIVALFALACFAWPQDASQIERGRYLVEEVARCGMCHTPRDQRGLEDRARALQGGAIWFEPVRRVQDWAYSAPPLAGLPGFTQDQAVRILETGATPDARRLRSPMPPFRLKHDEAVSIVAYLKSLKPPVR